MFARKSQDNVGRLLGATQALKEPQTESPFDNWDPEIKRPKTRGEVGNRAHKSLAATFDEQYGSSSTMSMSQLRSITKHKKKLSSAQR